MKNLNRVLILIVLATMIMSNIACAGKSSKSKVSRPAVTDTTNNTSTNTDSDTNTSTPTGQLSTSEQTKVCQGGCGSGRIEYQGRCLQTGIYGCGPCYGFAVATDGRAYCYLSSNYVR